MYALGPCSSKAPAFTRGAFWTIVAGSSSKVVGARFFGEERDEEAIAIG